MGKELVDQGFLPNQWLVLLFINGQPKFQGFSQQEVADILAKNKAGQAVLVEYMVSSAAGNIRHQTLAEAMSAKAKHEKAGERNVGLQPATPPKDLDPRLEQVWWKAPRDSDFPDWPV